MSTVSLKAYYGAETRRVAIPTEMKLNDFKQFIIQLFSIQQEQAQNITFQYQDDELDWVKVGIEHEWQEALRIAVTNKAVLRIKISKVKKDAKAILNDISTECKTKWEDNVAPKIDELSKQFEELKKDPRTKQLQENVDKFFDDLGEFIRKQEKEVPQQLTAWFNQLCAAVNPNKQFHGPSQVQVEAPVVVKPVEEAVQPEQAPVEQQQLMSSSLADFVVIQNELANSQVVPQQEAAPQEVVPPVVEAPAPVQQEAAEAVPAEAKPFEYAEAAQVLASMGFTNTKLNEHLLLKFKGDVARALDSLLTLQQHS